MYIVHLTEPELDALFALAEAAQPTLTPPVLEPQESDAGFRDLIGLDPEPLAL